MTRPVNVSLHIGAHKTATTHLQMTLERNATLLRKSSIKFVGPKYLRQEGQSLQKLFQFGAAQPMAPDQARAVLTRLAEGAGRVVFSEENLTGSMYQGDPATLFPIYSDADVRVERFVKTLPDQSVRAFLAIREPSSLLVSTYSQALFRGDYRGFEDFVASVNPARIQWSNLVERLRRVPGLEHLYVWRHEDYPGVSTQLFRRMLRWRTGRLVEVLDRQVHAGLSARAVAQVLAWAAHPEQEDLGRRARTLYPISDEFPHLSPWPEKLRLQSEAAYHADVVKIAAMEGVSLLGKRRALSSGHRD